MGQLAAEKEALEEQLNCGQVASTGLEAFSGRVQELEREKVLVEKSLVSLQLEVQRLREELDRKQEETKHSSPHDVRELFEAREQADALRKKMELLESASRQQASEAAELRRSLAQWRQHAESATEQASQARKFFLSVVRTLISLLLLLRSIVSVAPIAWPFWTSYALGQPN